MLGIIVNPQSNKGRGERLWRRLETVLKRQGTDYRQRFTKYKGHGVTLARAFQQKGARHLVVVGGDGTVSEVVRGLSPKRALLSVLCAGAGNDFAKMLGIRTWRDGLNAINFRCLQAVDVGVVNKSEYFINSIGIGLEARVAAVQHALPWKNAIGYLYGLLRVGLLFAPFPVTVTSPDFECSGDVLNITIGNGRFQGGMFMLTPQARVDDGLLDVCIIRAVASGKRLALMPHIMRGTHLGLQDVVMFQSRQVIIRSKVPLLMHRDGELGEAIGELAISVLPGHITCSLAR